MKSIELPDYIAVQQHIHDDMLEKFRHPHRFELGCFIIVNSGCAEISVNLSGYKVGADSLITVLPRSIIQLSGWSEDFNCSLVAFSAGFVKDLTLIRSLITQMDNIGNMPVLQLSADNLNLTHDYFSLLTQIYRRGGGRDLKSGAVGNLLLSFFYCVCDMYEKRNSDKGEMSYLRREDITRKFMTMVVKDCEKEREVRYYADKLCVTPQYLNAVVRETKGETASSIIKRVTILVVKARLKSSTESIQEIAGGLNFPNASFFAKFFKRETGMTPKQYRDS